MAEAADGRSETSRLRAVLPDIERALAAGVRRQSILDALHQDGFTMSMKTFEKALYRIRKRALKSTPDKTPPGSKTVDTTPQKKPATSDPISVAPDTDGTRQPVTRAGWRQIRDSVKNLDLDALVSGKGLITRE